MTAAEIGEQKMEWDLYGEPDVAIEAISAGASGQLFKRTHDGQVSVFDREAGWWEDLKGDPRRGRIAAGNVPPASRVTVEIVPDSTGLTRRGRSGALWSIVNPQDQWTQIGDDACTVEVTSDGGSIYRRRKDGLIESLDLEVEAEVEPIRHA